MVASYSTRCLSATFEWETSRISSWLEWGKQCRIIYRGRIDPFRYRDRFYPIGGIGLQQGEQIGHALLARIEPERFVSRSEDGGHPVVDGGHHLVRPDGDDRAGTQRRAIRLFPLLPQSRKGEQI